MIEIQLSTHERVLKRNIEVFRTINQKNLQLLVELCEVCAEHRHHIVPRDLDIYEQLVKDRWASTGAYCAVCGASRDEGIGWWCPHSPDHYCQYSGVQCIDCGKIFRTAVEAGKHGLDEHGKQNTRRIEGNEDDCLFCHMPMERK